MTEKQIKGSEEKCGEKFGEKCGDKQVEENK